MLLRLSRVIDIINERLGKWSSWLILAAVIISAGNAITRKVFHVSSNGWLELQWYLFSGGFLIAAGYTLLSNEHVRVDLLFHRYSRRVQLIVEIFGAIFFLVPFCVATILLAWPIVSSKFVSEEISSNSGGLILWPVWALIPFGFTLLLLQGLSEIIKRIAILRGDMPDAVAIADAEAASLPPHSEIAG